MSDEGRTDGRRAKSDRIAAVLTLEAIAFGIALVAPVTPSKTGATWSPAEVFTPDPSYLQKAVASFMTVNGIILLIGLLLWMMIKLGVGAPDQSRPH